MLSFFLFRELFIEKKEMKITESELRSIIRECITEQIYKGAANNIFIEFGSTMQDTLIKIVKKNQTQKTREGNEYGLCDAIFEFKGVYANSAKGWIFRGCMENCTYEIINGKTTIEAWSDTSNPIGKFTYKSPNGETGEFVISY